jgi:hypothetical protein
MSGTGQVGPETFHCKRCTRPVKYADIIIGRNTRGAAFDSRLVKGAGWTLTEEELPDEDGKTVATGRWLATYTKVDDRDPHKLAYRQHDCRPRRQNSS